MARDQPQINIRIPVDLRTKLDTAIARSGRSLTAEIVARLEQSFLQVIADTQTDVIVRYMLALNAYEIRESQIRRMTEAFERKKRKSEDERVAIRVATTELQHMANAIKDLRLKVTEILESSKQL